MAESTQFQPIITSNLTATIADSATESGAVDLSGTTLSAITFPSTFDGADITLKAATTASGTFVDVYDANGLQVTLSGAPSRIVAVEPAKLAGLQYIKLVADTAQTGDTTFTIITRPV